MSLSSKTKKQKKTYKTKRKWDNKKKGFAKIKNIQPILTPIKTLQTKKPDIKTHCLKSTVKETHHQNKETHHQNPTTKKLIVWNKKSTIKETKK